MLMNSLLEPSYLQLFAYHHGRTGKGNPRKHGSVLPHNSKEQIVWFLTPFSLFVKL